MSHDQLLTAGNGKLNLSMPDPEVTPKARRRTFSAEYKLRILDEAAACTRPGERGALLRREGLYSSHLTHWRRERCDGALAGLHPKKRGPKSDPLVVENEKLRGAMARLQAQLDRAETIIEVQSDSLNPQNYSQLLGLPTPNAPDANHESLR